MFEKTDVTNSGVIDPKFIHKPALIEGSKTSVRQTLCLGHEKELKAPAGSASSMSGAKC